MRFENPFQMRDVRRSEAVPDTPAIDVQATFQGIRVIVTFAQQYVNPVLAGQLNMNDREAAIVTTYRRIFSLLASLSVLDLPLDFQAIAMLSRSIFELFVDIKALHADAYPDGPRRFRVFSGAERLRIARKTVAFDAEHPGVLRRRPDAEQEFIAMDGQALDAEVLALWGRPRSPGHWSGDESFQDRARRVGLEGLYITHYPRLSAYVHPGGAGFVGLGLQAFASLVAICHILAAERAIDALDLLGQQMQLGKAIDGWDEKLRFVRSVQGLILVDLKLMSLGEAQRLVLELDWANERRGRPR